MPRASRRRCNHQRSQGSEAGSSSAFLTPGEVSPFWQSKQFYILALPPVMVILRRRVPLWGEAAPLLVESPPEDCHGPTWDQFQSIEQPSLLLEDPLGNPKVLLDGRPNVLTTSPGPPLWAGSPPTKRPPTFSRITLFTNTRERVHKYKSACSQRGAGRKIRTPATG